MTEVNEKEKKKDPWETGRNGEIGHYEWGCQTVKKERGFGE
jgi:hypothetical protein